MGGGCLAFVCWAVTDFCSCQKGFVLSSQGIIVIKQGFDGILAFVLHLPLCRCLIRRTSDILSKYLPVKIEQVVCCRYHNTCTLPGKWEQQQEGLKSCKKLLNACGNCFPLGMRL